MDDQIFDNIQNSILCELGATVTYEVQTYRGEKLLIEGSRLETKPSMETVIYIIKDSRKRIVFASDSVVSVRSVQATVKQESHAPALKLMDKKSIKV